MILPSIPRTSQPQGAVSVNWANPFSLGLRFLILPGLAVDVSGRTPMGAVVGAATRLGSSLVWPGNANGIRLNFGSRNPLGPLTDSTIVAVASTTASTAIGSGAAGTGIINTGGNALYTERASTGNDIYKLCLASDGSAALQVQLVYRNDVGTLIQQFVTDSSLNNGQRFAVAGVKRGQSITVYGRNVSSTGTFGSTDYSFTNANVMWVGNDVADATNDWNGPIDMVAGWGRALAAAEIRELQRNPWQLFAPIERSIWVPVSASGGASAGIGAATANGLTATANLARNVSAGIGAATANGLTATANLARNVSAGIGAATANGLTATANLARNVSAGIGAADAAGATARVDRALALPASIGAATASGALARVDAATSIAAGIGAASATGLSAAITASDATTITCSVGAAQAAGATARIDLAQWLAAQVAAAQAAGSTARIDLARWVTAQVAAAQADGQSAAVALNRVVAAAAAAAAADGATAAIVRAQLVAAQIAAAQASGLPADILGLGPLTPDMLSYVLLELQAGIAAELEASPIEVEIQND